MKKTQNKKSKKPSRKVIKKLQIDEPVRRIPEALMERLIGDITNDLIRALLAEKKLIVRSFEKDGKSFTEMYFEDK